MLAPRRFFFHNCSMPFTLAHPAAALPFRKTRLVFSAVVIGSMAPDFEYFLRLSPQGRFFHSLPGLVIYTLPVALAVLWLFHRSAKFAVMRLLPHCVQRRVICTDFSFGNLRRFALIVLSVFVGALTHVLWDSITHRESWLVQHWPPLHQKVVISWIFWLIHRPVMVCVVLQYLSGLIGMGILLIWFIAWFQRTAPVHPIESPLPRGKKIGIVFLLFGFAICGALLRTALFRATSPITNLRVFVVTWIALLWWALVALGWWWQPRLRSTPCAAAAAPASPADTHRRSPATTLPER
jgi:uncharacterized protein DUF4184